MSNLQRVLLILDVEPQYVSEMQQQPISKHALASLLHRGYAVAVGLYNPADDAPGTDEHGIPTTHAPNPSRLTQIEQERLGDAICDLKATDEELSARIDALGKQHAALCQRIMDMAAEIAEMRSQGRGFVFIERSTVK